MSSSSPERPDSRSRLEQRLRTDLAEQNGLRDSYATLEELEELGVRIQATAERLEPHAPESAIRAMRRKLAYDDLGKKLAYRVQLPRQFGLMLQVKRIRLKHLERRILDLARSLEPEVPWKAIDRAERIAREHLLDRHRFRRRYSDPTEDLDRALSRLPGVSRHLRARLIHHPEPTAQQRVQQLLEEIRRLDLLSFRHRHASQARRNLAFRGDVRELKAALSRVPAANDLLKEWFAEIYRNPARASLAMSVKSPTRSLNATIERFAEDPTAFGKLRGIRLPVLGDSSARSRALELVSQSRSRASGALARREYMESELEAAESFQHQQTKTFELRGASPSRDALLAELGRHMEVLEVDDFRPPLQPGQLKLLEELRRSEQQFLEPLRKASRRFMALHAGGGPPFVAEAGELADLYKGAPPHIVRRLSPPQVHVAKLAGAIVWELAKRVVKVASV